jgi:hypothetical protein
MNCLKCGNTTWILYYKDAPSPPYNEGQQLEYGERCSCYEPKRRSKDQFRKEDEIH